MNSKSSSSKKPGRRLSGRFYARGDALSVARDLLGKRLVVPAADGTRVSGVIVETEAYLGPEDKASHAYANRRTARTEVMYATGGVAYVYFIYGMYYQLNAVVNRRDVPHAVLVRALEPCEGVELMRQRRAVKRDRDLTNGPGKLCQALGIDKSYNTADLTGELIWIEDAPVEIAEQDVARGPRIGIDYAEEYAALPWRFWVHGNAHVSKKG